MMDTSMPENINTANAYKGQGILTNYHVYKHCIKPRNWKIAGLFEPNSVQGHVMNSGWFACWWAITQGYKHIYLYGVMDGEYSHKANGDSSYTNIFEGSHIFQNKGYDKFLKDIESGFNGRAKISRPLLYTDVRTGLIN
jgi:hypothetical protein